MTWISANFYSLFNNCCTSGTTSCCQAATADVKQFGRLHGAQNAERPSDAREQRHALEGVQWDPGRLASSCLCTGGGGRCVILDRMTT
jgi:hypothetical protein